MGLSEPLVATPTTDKVHLSVAHAIEMQMGCSIVGAEAAGKTETIKDLAKLFALFSLITNCNRFEFRSVHTILNGLMQCGGWGCFAAFDRIDADVMNSISFLLRSLQAKLKANKPQITVRGARLGFSVFIRPRVVIIFGSIKIGRSLTAASSRWIETLRFSLR